MLEYPQEVQVDEEDVMEFILDYSLLDYLSTYVKVYRVLGGKEMGRLIQSIERRFIYG
jgi:hypothetical protein